MGLCGSSWSECIRCRLKGCPGLAPHTRANNSQLDFLIKRCRETRGPHQQQGLSQPQAPQNRLRTTL